LEQWKRLALGAALLAKAKLEFEEPLEVMLPLAIPGAAASLLGEASLRILGATDGAVLTEGGEARVTPCPTAHAHGFTVPLQPHTYAVPGLGWMPPAGRTTFEFQASQVPLVEAGLALAARRHPEAFSQIRALTRWIAVNPSEANENLNFVSYSELPGGFAFRGIPHPHAAAEMCIHESHHNRLFCLEELEPILAGDDLGTEEGALFYSPWREDLRPLRGLFHAVYVNTPQTRFWLEVLRARDGDEGTLAYAEDLLIRYPLMLEIGILQLERFAEFTARGEVYFRCLAADVGALRAEVQALGLPRDRTSLRVVSRTGEIRPSLLVDGCRNPSSRDVVAEHIRLHDSERQIPAAWIEAELPSLRTDETQQRGSDLHA
jgi:HEXXH motif-containing protein